MTIQRWIHASARCTLSCRRRYRCRRFDERRPRPTLFALCADDPPHVLVAGRTSDPRELCRVPKAPQCLRTVDGEVRALDAWWWLPDDRRIEDELVLEELRMYSGLPLVAFEVRTLIGPEPARLGPRVGVVQLSPETIDDELRAHPHYLRALCAFTEGRRAHALPKRRREPPLPRSHRQGIEQLRDEAELAGDQATLERATTVLADGSDAHPPQPEEARRAALFALANEDAFGHASAMADRLELGGSIDDALVSGADDPF